MKTKTNQYKNLKVLVLDGPGRQVMPVLKGLHNLGCNITTICNSKLDLGYSSRYPNTKLLKKCKNDFDLESFVDSEIRSNKYDIVIPLSDKMTLFLAEHFKEYSSFVKMPIPSLETFMKAYDKQITMDICKQIGIPHTITCSQGESIDSFIKRNSGYPIVIKPRSACGSIGFHSFKNEEELRAFLKANGPIDSYLVQEYVQQNGRQFNVHAFFDDEGNPSFILPTEKCRWFPVDGGSSCFARTIKNETIYNQCFKLLKEIKWRGCCEIELIEDKKTGEFKVMEINGRTSACVKICQLAGINIAKCMIELSLGKNVENQQPPFKDVRMRCIHTDFLWFLKSKTRFKSKPSWFNNHHTHDQIYDFFDPIPFFAYSIQAITRYKKEMKKRSRKQ